MAKTRQQKEQAAQALAEQLRGAKTSVFANFQGLTMPQMEELRTKCRDQGITLQATKKTLLKLALAEIGLEVDTKQYEGGIAALFGADDEVAPAKTVAQFKKGKEAVSIFGGVMDGVYISAAEVKTLSMVPSKQELLGKLVGTLNAPVSGFVNVLAGNLRNFVGVLSAIKEAKA